MRYYAPAKLFPAKNRYDRSVWDPRAEGRVPRYAETSNRTRRKRGKVSKFEVVVVW